MLQIVPESKTPITPLAAANLTPPMVPVPAPQALQEEQKTKELIQKKLEDQRKRKEEERKRRREARMAELQKKQLEQDLEQPEVQQADKIEKASGGGGRILETIEREEDKEARILAEAITAVPEPESDQDEEDIQSFSAERRSKSKKKDDIR